MENPDNNENSNNNENNQNIEEYYDYLPADHPLMKNLQNALETQLKKEEEQLRLLQKEKSEELRKIKRKREDIGVNLYNYQQRYAKLEEIFNEEYNKYMVLKSQLEDTEKKLNEQVQKFQKKASSIKEQQRMVLQATEELNQLNAMLKYVEQYNQEVESQIQVTNRNAQVVEKKIVENESDKKKQDFLIDYLEEQIKNLHEKKLLFEAQLTSQAAETKEAKENLVEAQEEIRNIIEKKKIVLKDWNKAVISMKTKDKALQIVRDKIKEQESDKLKYSSQISRYRELIQKEVFDYAEYEHQLNMLSNKKKAVNEIISMNEIQFKAQEQKRLFIFQSIKKTNNEIKILEEKESNLLSQIDLIEKNKLKLLDMTRKLQEENLITLSTKDTHEKQTQNMIKANNKLERDLFNLQVDIDLKNNEISRVEIDELNVETQNESISKKIKLMNKEIEKLEQEFKKQEAQIKKNHEDLEKKQLQVDRLNKQFGHLTKNKGSEDEGFFEVKIKELQSDIANLTQQISTTEENWIKKKTSLVNKVNILNSIKDNATDMRSKKMILSHKKLRLNNNLLMHEKEIRDVEISLKNLRYDMNKYNGMLSKNVNSKDKLTLKFFDVEIEFKEKLKQMENLSLKYELEIESLREEKSDILTQILEVERQIHLWERKIKLQNKMQDIIKPEKGKKEIDDITYTLHRQEIIYKKLKQEQEQAMKDMVMEVNKKDYIKLKFPSKIASNSANTKTKTLNQDREIKNLKDDLNHIINEKKVITKKLNTKKEEWNNMQQEIDKNNNIYQDMESRVVEYEQKRISDLLEKNSLSCKTVQLQKKSKIVEEFVNRPRIRNKDAILKDYEEMKSKNDELISIILNNAKDIFDSDLANLISSGLNI